MSQCHDGVILPALTPEEWEAFAAKDERRGAAGADDPRERHALAAKCLHGQPFGFTEEDVRDERQAYHDAVVLARHYREGGNEGLRLACIARAARHFDRANRIEALLPPREPDWDENEAAWGWPPVGGGEER